MIALVPGSVEGFIFDLPSRTSGTHDLLGVLSGDRQAADPLPVSLETFLIDLVVLQGIGQQISVAVVQRYLFDDTLAT